MGLFKSIKGYKQAVSDAYATNAEMQAEAAAAAPATTKVANAAAPPETRALLGDAGDVVYGPEFFESTAPEAYAAMSFKDMMKQGWSEALSQGSSTVAPAPPPASNADRPRVAAEELTARQAALAPYLAPGRPPVELTRIAVGKKASLPDVAAAIAATGLDGSRIFGVARVPDQIQGGDVVEWQIVHVGGSGAVTGSTPLAVVEFEAADQLVGRCIGEPSVLDEEIGLAYLRGAGISARQCVGICRQLAVRHFGGGDDGTPSVVAAVTGAIVFHHADLPTGEAERMRRAAPLTLGADVVDGIHVEVLNWRVISDALGRSPHTAVPVPSRFPHLPNTADELLQTYLAIVGIDPADCYSAQVTEDTRRNLIGSLTSQRAYTFRAGTAGADFPCADGTVRPRLIGGSHVVVVHRDDPAYVEGRERWAAYQQHVLDSRLERGTGLRRPVERPDFESLPGGLRGLARAVDKVDRAWNNEVHEIKGADRPHRYCWPPLDAK